MKKWIVLPAMVISSALFAMSSHAAPQSSARASGAHEPSRQVVSRININTADAKTLDNGLLGVGPAKAEAIVAWRKQKGPFKAIAELSAVKGMGPALIERNKDRISLR